MYSSTQTKSLYPNGGCRRGNAGNERYLLRYVATGLGRKREKYPLLPVVVVDVDRSYRVEWYEEMIQKAEKKEKAKE